MATRLKPYWCVVVEERDGTVTPYGPYADEAAARESVRGVAIAYARDGDPVEQVEDGWHRVGDPSDDTVDVYAQALLLTPRAVNS